MLGSQIRFENVTKAYGSTSALSDFELTIEPGEFVTLLGASGSGKSTALNILAGFSEATSGNVYIDDRSVSGVVPEKRNVGMVFQNFALFPHKSVAENVAFPLTMRGHSKDQIKQRVGEALDKVQLSQLSSRKPAELSGGQQQRVALARAIVFEPPVLLMDEALSALDLKLRKELQEEIRSIHKDLGATIIFVTHDQTEALTMSDRVAVIDAGRIVQVDTPQNLYDLPKNQFVANFIGQSNILAVQSVDDGIARVDDLDQSIACNRPDANAISIRPERLQLVQNSPDNEMVQISGVIIDQIFNGPTVERSVRLTSGKVLLARHQHINADDMPQMGQQITLTFHPTDCVPLVD